VVAALAVTALLLRRPPADPAAPAPECATLVTHAVTPATHAAEDDAVLCTIR
jgi:hypothetical protein